MCLEVKKLVLIFSELEKSEKKFGKKKKTLYIYSIKTSRTQRHRDFGKEKTHQIIYSQPPNNRE